MSGSYGKEFDRVLQGFGLSLKDRKHDIAHWVLCLSPDGTTGAHLAYLPADPRLSVMLPVELFTLEERESLGIRTIL